MDLAANRQDNSWILNNTYYSVDEAIEAQDLIEDSIDDLPSFEELGDRMTDHVAGIVAALRKAQHDLMPAKKLMKFYKEYGL